MKDYEVEWGSIWSIDYVNVLDSTCIVIEESLLSFTMHCEPMMKQHKELWSINNQYETV